MQELFIFSSDSGVYTSSPEYRSSLGSPNSDSNQSSESSTFYNESLITSPDRSSVGSTNYSTCVSPNFNAVLLPISNITSVDQEKDQILPTRGRPKAADVPILIEQGKAEKSGIKCPYCERTFPRQKSLNVHKRIHTGERPFICDFPECSKKFVQSGQLDTHQRLHAGYKPYKCADPDCPMRFTHSNRRCKNHPSKVTKIDGRLDSCVFSENQENYSIEQRNWVERYLKKLVPRDLATIEQRQSERPVKRRKINTDESSLPLNELGTNLLHNNDSPSSEEQNIQPNSDGSQIPQQPIETNSCNSLLTNTQESDHNSDFRRGTSVIQFAPSNRSEREMIAAYGLLELFYGCPYSKICSCKCYFIF